MPAMLGDKPAQVRVGVSSSTAKLGPAPLEIGLAAGAFTFNGVPFTYNGIPFTWSPN